MAQYVKEGRELDQEKLGNLLEPKYHTISDTADQLGGVPVIRNTFVALQRYSCDARGDRPTVDDASLTSL